MEIETKVRKGALKKLAYGLKKVHVKAVNEKVAEMNAQPLVDTGRDTLAWI